jgi:hypothetical protein
VLAVLQDPMFGLEVTTVRIYIEFLSMMQFDQAHFNTIFFIEDAN